MKHEINQKKEVESFYSGDHSQLLWKSRSPFNNHNNMFQKSNYRPEQRGSSIGKNENQIIHFSQEHSKRRAHQCYVTPNPLVHQQEYRNSEKEPPIALDKGKDHLFRVIVSTISTSSDNHLIEIIQKTISLIIELLLELMICHGEKKKINEKLSSNMSVVERRNILYISHTLKPEEYHDISAIKKLRNMLIHELPNTSLELSKFNQYIQSLCSNDSYTFDSRTNRGLIINSFFRIFCSLLIRIEYYYLRFNPVNSYDIYNPNLDRLVERDFYILCKYYKEGKMHKAKDDLKYAQIKQYINKISSYARSQHEKYDINNLECGNTYEVKFKRDILKDLGPWSINDKDEVKKYLPELFRHLLVHIN